MARGLQMGGVLRDPDRGRAGVLALRGGAPWGAGLRGGGWGSPEGSGRSPEGLWKAWAGVTAGEWGEAPAEGAGWGRGAPGRVGGGAPRGPEASGTRVGGGLGPRLTARVRSGSAEGSQRGFRGEAARVPVLPGPRGPQRGAAGLRRRPGGPARAACLPAPNALPSPCRASLSRAAPLDPRRAARPAAPARPPQPPPGTAAAAGSAAAISPADRSGCPAPEAQSANSPPPGTLAPPTIQE